MIIFLDAASTVTFGSSAKLGFTVALAPAAAAAPAAAPAALDYVTATSSPAVVAIFLFPPFSSCIL